MKNVVFLLIALFAFSLSSCLTIPDPDPDPGVFDYAEYCDDLNGGNFSVKINGKNWSTSCVQASYAETITDDYSYKLLYLYAYNGDGAYFGGSNIEMAWVVWTEVISDGVTETSQGAYFLDGFFNYQQALNNPDYDPENITSYTSDEENENDILNISSLTADKVKGNLSFELTEEDSGVVITMSGDFSANIVQ